MRDCPQAVERDRDAILIILLSSEYQALFQPRTGRGVVPLFTGRLPEEAERMGEEGSPIVRRTSTACSILARAAALSPL